MAEYGQYAKTALQKYEDDLGSSKIGSRNIITAAFAIGEWAEFIPVIAGGNPIRQAEILEANTDLRDCIDALQFQLMQMQLYSPSYLLSKIFGGSSNKPKTSANWYLQKKIESDKKKYGHKNS